jgi:hypothetical protein
VCIRKRFAESRAVLGEVGGKSIGVGRIDKGVPAYPRMTLGIRQWWQVRMGLDEELRSVTEEDGKERILLRLLKRCFKSQLVAIERDGSIDVCDNEER